ncbi:MAG: hypothetical protein HYX22_02270 [Candidatus Yanofskybacteria bacterium]|nr:hypothetical protein [Candidatus Yanofskybacteria bacterium]
MTRTKALLSLVVILLASSLIVTGCSTKPVDASTVLTPHRTSVYFVVDRPNGFVAYAPEGSVFVNIKIQPDITEPYVEVPRTRINTDYSSKLLDGTYVAWIYGGTLYVKDLEQFKGLLLKAERE